MSKQWVVPKYSRNAVRRAGEACVDWAYHLRDSSELNGSYWDRALSGFSVISNWRAAHAYPMHANLMHLRRRAALVQANPTVVQRLKRLPSILDKLYRMPKMGLERMQDVGGCRAIMKDASKAAQLKDDILSGSSRNSISRFDDYISNPKQDGYRGFHLVTKYGGSKGEFSNMSVEIQIRSELQHAWATAVEIVDTFTGLKLKTRNEENTWATFFKLVSIEFARMEKCPVFELGTAKETLDALREVEAELRAFDQFAAFTLSTRQIGELYVGKSGYTLIAINFESRKVETRYFANVEEAEIEYAKIEARDDVNVNAVLVTAQSVASLRKAYPNYFADSRVFARTLRKLVEGA